MSTWAPVRRFIYQDFEHPLLAPTHLIRDKSIVKLPHIPKLTQNLRTKTRTHLCSFSPKFRLSLTKVIGWISDFRKHLLITVTNPQNNIVGRFCMQLLNCVVKSCATLHIVQGQFSVSGHQASHPNTLAPPYSGKVSQATNVHQSSSKLAQMIFTPSLLKVIRWIFDFQVFAVTAKLLHPLTAACSYIFFSYCQK